MNVYVEADLTAAAYAPQATPLPKVDGRPMTEAELEAAWAYKERRALELELDYELEANDPTRYPGAARVREYLAAHPGAEREFRDLVWSVFYDCGFHTACIPVIEKVSGLWLDEARAADEEREALERSQGSIGQERSI